MNDADHRAKPGFDMDRCVCSQVVLLKLNGLFSTFIPNAPPKRSSLFLCRSPLDQAVLSWSGLLSTISVFLTLFVRHVEAAAPPPRQMRYTFPPALLEQLQSLTVRRWCTRHRLIHSGKKMSSK